MPVVKPCWYHCADRPARIEKVGPDGVKHSISIIVPTRNEVSNLPPVLELVWPYADELIVVDGHSTDGTRELAADCRARVLLDDGKGKGAALRMAIEAAQGDILVFIDADGSHDPRDIPSLVKPIVDGVSDHVSGSRMLGGSDELHATLHQFVRLFGSQMVTLSINYTNNVRLTDCQNGFRAIRRDVARALDLHENITTIEQEMVIKSVRLGYRLTEVPTHEYARANGESNFRVSKVFARYITSWLYYLLFWRPARRLPRLDGELTPAPSRNVNPFRMLSDTSPVLRWGLALLIAAFVLIAGLYSVIIPPFETPDEIWHFAFIQYVATGHGLPVSTPNTQELWRQQGVQAPGYYLAAAALTAWVDQSDFPALYARANPHAAIGRPDAVANRNYLVHHPDEAWRWQGSVLALHLARLFSVVLGAITLWAVYKTLALLLGPGVALLGTALFAFVPQFVFISAAASNDNAINALAALVLWRLVALVIAPAPHLDGSKGAWLAGWSAGNKDFFWIGCLLGLAVLAKLSALGLVVLAGLAVLIVAWQARSWRVLLRAGLWIGLPALVIGGWWYLRNWRLYGDPLAWNVWQGNILLRAAPADWQTILSELVGLERSFWGFFGWLNLGYPAWVYAGFRALEILTAVGLVARAAYWLLRVRSVDRRWLGAGLLLGWLVVLLISWLRFTRIAPAAQGRYFHPGAPAIALLLALGLSGAGFGLTHRAGGARRWRASLAAVGWVAAAGLLALSLATPFWIIRPAYATPIAAETLQTLTSVRAELGGQFAILGIAAEPAELLPGANATITVRWQALNPGPVDYSVFVHLLDGDGLVVAQADSMPGGGLLPTSAWQPGQIRTERYEVTIPPLAYVPDQGRWSVGLYDHRTNERLPLRVLEPVGEAVTAGAPVTALEENGLAFGAATIRAPAGSVPNAVNIEFYDNVTLAGYSFSSRRLHPGDSLTVKLYWHARGPVQKEYTAFAHLLDASFQTQGGHDGVPRPPKSAWPSDRAVEETHVFTVAPGALAGLFQVEVGLYTRPDFDRLRLIQPGAAVGADRVLIGPLTVVP